MTRSTRTVPTYKQAKKAFKQEATNAGYTCKLSIYAQWSQNVAEAARDKARRPPLHSARNPRRMDGAKWNGSAFVCPGRVDDGDIYIPGHRTVDGLWRGDGNYEEYRSHKRMEVSLMDLARPAKPRGVKKEFEVVDKLPSVIVLEDEEGIWEYYNDCELDLLEEDWEEVLVEGSQGRGGSRTFADVLKGG